MIWQFAEEPPSVFRNYICLWVLRSALPLILLLGRLPEGMTVNVTVSHFPVTEHVSQTYQGLPGIISSRARWNLRWTLSGS